MRRREWVLAGALILMGFLAGRPVGAEDGAVASLRFVVVRDHNGKPLKNAAVVLHPLNEKGKQARGGLELKTDTDGHAGFDGIPYGPLRVQVLMTGYQTFGEDYDINKPEMEITIKLKRPQGQYSIYQDHPEEKKDDKKDSPKAPDQKQAEPQKQQEQKPQ